MPTPNAASLFLFAIVQLAVPSLALLEQLLATMTITTAATAAIARRQNAFHPLFFFFFFLSFVRPFIACCWPWSAVRPLPLQARHE